MTIASNQFAGIGAGRPPEFIEMQQFGANYKSGAAQLWGR